MRVIELQLFCIDFTLKKVIKIKAVTGGKSKCTFLKNQVKSVTLIFWSQNVSRKMQPQS